MNLRKIFYATICAPLFACALNAQMLTSGATAINILAPKWKMGVSVDASGEYSAPADLSTKIDGDLAVYSASANVKFQGAYADKHFLTLSLNYTYSQYDFSSAAAPFSSANGASALAFYTARISERWGAFGIASASIGSETGASIWGGRIILVLRKPHGGDWRNGILAPRQHMAGVARRFHRLENHRQAAPAHIFRRRAALRYFRGQFSYSKRRRRIQKLLLQAC